MSVTFEPSQWVKAAFLVTSKKAVTVEEVRPGHFDSLKGMGTVLPQRLTCATAGLDHLIILAGRGQYRTAYEAYLGGALPIEQAMDDAQEEVLCPRFSLQAILVAKDVWEYGSRGAVIQNMIFTFR